MNILVILLTMVIGFAAVIYVTSDKLQDIVNHTVCSKDKTVITCHYDDVHI